MSYLSIVAGELREDLGWAESKVKRGPGGKFSSKGGGKALSGLGARKSSRRKSGISAGGGAALLATGLAGAAGLGMMAIGARNASRPGNAPPPPRVAKPATPPPPTAAQRSAAQSHNSEVMRKGLEDLKGRIASGEYKRPKTTAEMVKEPDDQMREYQSRRPRTTEKDWGVDSKPMSIEELDEFMLGLGGPGGNVPSKEEVAKTVEKLKPLNLSGKEEKRAPAGMPSQEEIDKTLKSLGDRKRRDRWGYSRADFDNLDAAEAEMERQEQEGFAKEDELSKRRDSAITPRGQYELRRRLGLTHDSTLEYAGSPRNDLIRELRKDFARAWSE